MSQTLPSCSPHCTSQPIPLRHCFKATFGKRRQPCYIGVVRVRSSNNDSGSKQTSGISEDVLQRLRLAEEEAVVLREELAKAKAEALERVGVLMALPTPPEIVCLSLDVPKLSLIHLHSRSEERSQPAMICYRETRPLQKKQMSLWKPCELAG